VTTHRFVIGPDAVAGDRVSLPPAVRHQVRTVLRLHDGDRIVVLTGDGAEATCRLDGDGCHVEERRVSAGEPTHRLTIVQALLKGDALEDVIRLGTEVGVAEFRLVVTERCVVRELKPQRLERLRAVAREATEQSERGRVPAVVEPTPLADALGSGAVLLAEREDGRRLRDLPPPTALVIGPEGGFTPSELAEAERSGAALAGLGPRILRSRTVAVAAAAAVLSRTGDFA
jgi:16S rRNA (uracil1498-N3)-methyltransferase